MSDELQVLEGLRGDVKALSGKIDSLERRTGHRIFAIAAACVVMLVLLAGIIVLGWQGHSQASCVRSWANANAGRTNALLPVSTARTDALDQLIRTIAPGPGETPEQRQAAFQSALATYLKASDNYSRAADQNPPPLAPAYRC